MYKFRGQSDIINGKEISCLTSTDEDSNLLRSLPEEEVVAILLSPVSCRLRERFSEIQVCLPGSHLSGCELPCFLVRSIMDGNIVGSQMEQGMTERDSITKGNYRT